MATAVAETGPKQATVEDRYTKPPILTEGDLTPEIAKDYETACRDFFDTKGIEESDQVRHLLVGIKDYRMRDWISGQRDHIVGLSFDEFMKEIRSNYLPPDWEPRVRIRILSANFNHKRQSFWDFASYIQKQNSLLLGTPSHFDLARLRTQIEAKLDSALSIMYFERNLDATADFHTWLNSIRLLDDTRRQSEKRAREIADEVFRQSKKPLTTANKSNVNVPVTQKGARLPPLSDEEKRLLRENSGCYRCRRPFVSCRTSNCTESFPDPGKYQPWTQARIDALKASGARASRPVAATVPSTASSSTATVAAVLPTSPVGGSHIEDIVSDEDSDI